MFKKILLISTALLLSTGVYAEEKTVEDDYNDWKANIQEDCSKNIRTGSICDIGNLVDGEANIVVTPQDPHWGEYRNAAYIEALTDAYVKFAREISLTHFTEVTTELGKNNPNIKISAKDKIDVIGDKMLAMMEGKLDAELREMDIDPDQFRATPEIEKKVLLFKRTVIDSVSKAMGEVSGLIPYQTFEGPNDKNIYTIKVALLKDPEKISVIKSLFIHKDKIQPNALRKNATSIYERFVKNLSKEKLYENLGVRATYDEEGYPTFISYGQWKIDESFDMISGSMNKDFAKDQARMVAEDGFALFFDVSTTSTTQRTHTIDRQKYMEYVKNGVTIEDYIKQSASSAVESLTKTKTRGGFTNFPGIREIHNWTYKHPENGHRFYGVVLMWSPKTAKAANAIKNIKPKSLSEMNGSQNSSEATSQFSNRVIRGIESDF